jgi:hypothetical protein
MAFAAFQSWRAVHQLGEGVAAHHLVSIVLGPRIEVGQQDAGLEAQVLV